MRRCEANHKKSRSRRAIKLLFVLPLLAPPLPAAHSPLLAQDLPARISEYMDAQVSVNHFEGAILVGQHGKVVFDRTYRYRHQGKNNHDQIQVPIGSIGKQFIAAAVLQLRDQGQLRLQDSVCSHISNCPAAWKPVEIVNLLNQTSGIPDGGGAPDDLQNSGAVGASADFPLPQSIGPLEFAPGSEVRPGAAGYEILAALIEKVSGESFAKYLQDHIFQPLGMHNTFGRVESIRSKRAASMAGEGVSLLTPSDWDPSLFPIGAIYSTADDIYRWDRALYGQSILSSQSVEDMSRPSRDGYAFGSIVLKEFGRRAIIQGSGLDLFYASLRRYPDDDSCVIVLGLRKNIDAARISHDLAAMIFAEGYQLPVPNKEIKLDPAIYDSYAGQYLPRPYFPLTVTRQGGRLIARGGNLSAVELLPESETRFFVRDLDTHISFVKSAGRVVELVVQQGGLDIPAPRVK
jgi:CubicO group peptidase (beta-lactamase class C family)